MIMYVFLFCTLLCFKANNNNNNNNNNKNNNNNGLLGYNMTSGDHPNYNTVRISLNTEKSPGDIGKLAAD